MNWVVWRQHRAAALAAAAGLAAIAAWLMPFSLQVTRALTCPPQGCSFGSLVGSGVWGHVVAMRFFVFLPAVAGIFWGAPLIAKELESRTQLLAWTQSVSRAGWFAWKAGWLVALTIAASGLLSWLVTWAFPAKVLAPLGGVFQLFDTGGFAPVAYALFAAALGLAAGAVIGRMIPAMVTTAAVWLGVRLAVVNLRPHFMTPLSATYAAGAPVPHAENGAWVLSSDFVNRAGQVVSERRLMQLCPGGPSGKANSNVTCLQAHGLMLRDVFQPASRFWAFQSIESAIFVGLSIALLAFTAWWVVRRAA